MTSRGPYRFVDLFAGCGGFSLGFTEESFRSALAVENFRPACETYAANVPTEGVLQADVRKVEPEDFPPAVDLMIGGPPCEAFTVAAKDRRTKPIDRLYKDPVGSLTLQYIIHLKALKPRVFVMENVPGILEGELGNELRMLFARAGYPEVHFNDLLAEDHGTPSHRRRIFVSNVRIDPPETRNRATVWDTIGDLESLEVDIPNHVPMPIRGKRGQRMREMEEGESMYHYRTQSGRVHGAWTRLVKDEPAPTVMGLSRFIHPTEDRLLTPREHARLMGYPDDFVFYGSKNEQYGLAGESVPPPLAQAIAREVSKALDAGRGRAPTAEADSG